MKEIKEEWKSLEFCELKGYSVSNTGKVYSDFTKRILKFSITRKGYLSANLFRAKGTKHYAVHRLVALAFIPNPENKPQINHIDGDKQNNTVTNLEWCTGSENQQHAYRNGLHDKQLKIDDATADEICKAIMEKVPLTEIAKQLEYKGVTKDIVGDIRRRKTWTHISVNYNFPEQAHYNDPLPDELVHLICRCMQNGMSDVEIRCRYGLPKYLVHDIRRHRGFNYITEGYFFDRRMDPLRDLKPDVIREICKTLVVYRRQVKAGTFCKTHPDMPISYNVMFKTALDCCVGNTVVLFTCTQKCYTNISIEYPEIWE